VSLTLKPFRRAVLKRFIIRGSERSSILERGGGEGEGHKERMDLYPRGKEGGKEGGGGGDG